MKNAGYSIYVHIFPDHKRYVGLSKSDNLKNRWNGGLGYEHQEVVFGAICRFGWDNINHYTLFDSLTKKEAMIIEAYLIKKWRTYQFAYGYNKVVPKVTIPDDFVLPKIHRKKVVDDNHLPVVDRVKSRTVKTREQCCVSNNRALKIFCEELNEVFPSISQAASAVGVNPNCISRHLRGKQKYAGVHYFTGAPLHWVYVD